MCVCVRVWALADTMRWEQMEGTGDVPSPRGSTSLVAFGPFLIMFGGFNGSVCFNDLFVFHIGTNRIARWSVAVALGLLHTLTNVVGCTESRQWKKWSVATGEWPTARAAIAASMIGNRICFFGGFSSDNNDFAELVVLEVAISD